MSNIKSERFSLSQFAAALGEICAKTDDKAAAMGEFLAINLEKASRAWLLGGSDSLNQALSKIENSGKSAVAVKIRKVIRTVGYDGFTPWGTLQGFSVVPREGLIGGNSERAKDKPARAEACAAFGAAIRTVTLQVFAKVAPDGGRADPLATFGAYSTKTIGEKLKSASAMEMVAALQRIADLSQLIKLALALHGVEPAAVEPAAVEPAAVEPAAVEPAAVEPAAVEPAAVEPAAAETPKKATVRIQREKRTGTNG